MPNQPKKTTQPSLQEPIEKELAIHEAIELIEECRKAFHAKLDEIEALIDKTGTEKEKKELKHQAEYLFSEYKKTIATIEEAIEKISSTDSKPTS